jgi:hypothetical protein
MPSLDVLFGPIMDSFLKPRPETVHDSGVKVCGEDVETEQEHSEAVIPGARRPLAVNQEDIKALVDIFRIHAIKRTPFICASSIIHSNIYTASSQLIANGHFTSVKNGKVARTCHSAAGTSQNDNTNRPEHPESTEGLSAESMPPSPPTTVNGKKRKKPAS